MTDKDPTPHTLTIMTERLSLYLPSKIPGVKRLFSSNRLSSNVSEISSVDNALSVQFVADDNDDLTSVSSPKLFAISTSNVPSTTQLDTSKHFFAIERQFERLQADVQTRPLTSFSDLQCGESGSSSPRAPRHVDLVQALFSQHRYQINGGSTFCPTHPYNEDVADRNIHGWRNETIGKNTYSRIVSAIYQEDVADRNIAKAQKSDPSPIQPPPRSPLRLRNPLLRDQGRKTSLTARTPFPKETQAGLGQPVSHKLESTNRGSMGSKMSGAPRSVRRELKTQRSAPVLTSNHSNFPVITVNGREANLDSQKPKLLNRSSLVVPPSRGSLSPASVSTTPKPGSRRNVRDLSINTELASSQRLPIKIEHRAIQAIQPPTPSYRSNERDPSIAEIVHSPLPSLSPAVASFSYKADEIMDLFKKVYMSSYATDPHPTFETLQDAIVREINSHDAFRHVPIPDNGPPFTPLAKEHSFKDNVNELAEDGLEGNRDGSGGPKPTRKPSRSRGRRKSVSLINFKAQDKNTPKKRPLSSTRRRRHTYTERPSTSWTDRSASQATLEALGASNPQISSVSDGDTFVKTHRKRKSEPAPPSPALEILQFPPLALENAPPKYSAEASITVIQQSQNVGNNQSRESSREKHVIRTVDKNEVTYIVNATEPLTACELLDANTLIGNSTNNRMGRLEIRRSRSNLPLSGDETTVPRSWTTRSKEITKFWRTGS